jgi:hypothetical protein
MDGIEVGRLFYVAVPLLILLASHFGLAYLIGRKFPARISAVWLGGLSIATSITWYYLALGIMLSLALCSQCDAFERTSPYYYATLGLPLRLCDAFPPILVHLPYFGLPLCHFYPFLLVTFVLFAASILVAWRARLSQQSGRNH